MSWILLLMLFVLVSLVFFIFIFSYNLCTSYHRQSVVVYDVGDLPCSWIDFIFKVILLQLILVSVTSWCHF